MMTGHLLRGGGGGDANGAFSIAGNAVPQIARAADGSETGQKSVYGNSAHAGIVRTRYCSIKKVRRALGHLKEAIYCLTQSVQVSVIEFSSGLDGDEPRKPNSLTVFVMK